MSSPSSLSSGLPLDFNEKLMLSCTPLRSAMRLPIIPPGRPDSIISDDMYLFLGLIQ